MSTLDRNLRSRRYSKNKQSRFQERNDRRREKKKVYSQLDCPDQNNLIFNEKETKVDKEFEEMIRYIELVKSFPPNIRRKYYPFNQILKLLEEDPNGPFHISDFYGCTLNLT